MFKKTKSKTSGNIYSDIQPNYLINIIFPPIIVLLFHSIATVLSIYNAFYWFDTLMHAFGGIAIAISTFMWLQGFYKHTPTLVKIVSMVGITAIAAVAWEWMEFFLDYYFNQANQASLYDTMKDLYCGIAGAIFTSLAIYWDKFKN